MAQEGEKKVSKEALCQICGTTFSRKSEDDDEPDDYDERMFFRNTIEHDNHCGLTCDKCVIKCFHSDYHSGCYQISCEKCVTYAKICKNGDCKGNPTLNTYCWSHNTNGLLKHLSYNAFEKSSFKCNDKRCLMCCPRVRTFDQRECKHCNFTEDDYVKHLENNPKVNKYFENKIENKYKTKIVQESLKLILPQDVLNIVKQYL